MQWLKQFFNKKGKSKKPGPNMSITPDQAKKMLKMIESTQEEELSCDDVFELLDVYAEMAQHGEDMAKLLPLVKHHLEMCPDCREEYEALMRILDKQSN
jgi:hypothetical protein